MIESLTTLVKESAAKIFNFETIIRPTIGEENSYENILKELK